MDGQKRSGTWSNFKKMYLSNFESKKMLSSMVRWNLATFIVSYSLLRIAVPSLVKWKNTPFYSRHTNYSVTFKDNYAPGMRGFVKYIRFGSLEHMVPDRVEEREMRAWGKDEKEFCFRIPVIALNSGDFRVRVVDEDGNSDSKEFTVDYGVVFRK